MPMIKRLKFSMFFLISLVILDLIIIYTDSVQKFNIDTIKKELFLINLIGIIFTIVGCFFVKNKK